MDTLWQDIRFGFRMLFKNSALTAVAVLSLALGIGANTAVFSLVDKALVRLLPVASPEQLVIVIGEGERGQNTSFSYPLYVDFRDRNEVFSDLITFSGTPFSLSDGGQTERVPGMLVSGNYFSTLGVNAALGRTFLPDEDATPGTHPVAVVGYGLWQRRFGADPAVIGKTISLNGHTFTIIGVAPPEFTGTIKGSSPDIYVPMMMEAEAMPTWQGALTNRNMTWLEIMGRLKPGVTREQAEASLTLTANQIAQVYPDNVDKKMVLADGSKGVDYAMRDLSGPLVWMMFIVVLVLLIACANVANLLLARANARRKEIAVRLAVGANRARLVRQLLTESVLLSVMGGVAGLMVAIWLTDLLLLFKPTQSFALEGGLDRRVLIFSLTLSLLTGIVFGLAPAFQTSKPDLVAALKDESATAGRGARRMSLRNLLVVLQVALSLLVLVSAGLCVRSLQKLVAIDAGFDPAKIIVMSLDLSLNGYKQEQGRQFYSQLVERVSGLPGVESASLAAIVPLGGGGMRRSLGVEGYEPPPDAPPLNFNFNIVGANYFQTMGIQIIRGRDFSPQDVAGAPKVVIINETVAHKYWPNQDAVGKHLKFGSPRSRNEELIEIVGIAKDSKYRQLTEVATDTMYLPLAQNYRANMTLHVRTAADSKAMIAAIRSEVAARDPNLPVYSVRTMEEQKSNSLYTSRMAATLLGVFGLVAMLLAAVGIYGVMSYSVNRRTREIGIRMALGANRRDVLKMVLGEGMLLVMVGLAAGLGATLAVTRFIGSLLYGVSATDPATFAGISLILIAVALLACYLPARHATKVDPMVALRYE
jgi:predicted permease